MTTLAIETIEKWNRRALRAPLEYFPNRSKRSSTPASWPCGIVLQMPRMGMRDVDRRQPRPARLIRLRRIATIHACGLPAEAW
jgi:hypothetical protein